VRLRGLTPGTGPPPPTGEVPGACRTAGPGGHQVRWGGEEPDRRPPARWLAVRPAVRTAPPRKANGPGSGGQVRLRSRGRDVLHPARSRRHRRPRRQLL